MYVYIVCGIRDCGMTKLIGCYENEDEAIDRWDWEMELPNNWKDVYIKKMLIIRGRDCI